ncbi:tRNA lysidine(34) synthetase TilS [Gordonia sp. FQ]|uniref:tRNA lysidine(34) synthetase TilS n=1 Tax=Gordonia sp. FQ TaxID=3446634 RepID=UPI003F87D944
MHRYFPSPLALRPRVVASSATHAQDRPVERVCVALSGGPDSLALTAAAVRAGLDVTALVVDHGLQSGSARIAAEAADAARTIGARAQVLKIDVCGPGGPEAAARRGRYAALDAARAGRPVLLGHTLDDQAETVLLGLGRGSGARSLAGMADWNEPWGRPLLRVRRAQTRRACAEWGLSPWHDPHNDDPRFTRVRLRHEVLPLLDDVLHGGAAEALARTAAQLRADSEALDLLAADLLDRARTPGGLDVAALAAAPAALRTRALRSWLTESGAAAPSFRLTAQVEALVTDWHGQGPIAVGGDAAARLVIARRAGVLTCGSVGR